MDLLVVIATLAAIANILTFLWQISFGSKTFLQVIRRRPTRGRSAAPKQGTVIGYANLVSTLGLIAIVIFFQLRANPAGGETKSGSSTPIPKFTPSPASTSLPPGWRTILSPFSPMCNDPGGTSWQLISGNATCDGSALAMRQTSNSFAELDLTQVQGKAFSLTAFRVQVQVRFVDHIDNNTAAAFYVQIPQAANSVGGYLFELFSNSPPKLFLGGPIWVVEAIYKGKNASGTGPVSVGSVGTTQGDNLKTATMAIEVRDAEIRYYVNGNPVSTNLVPPLSIDSNASSSAFGLMVDKEVEGGYPSSTVQFSQFELDEPNSGG